MLGHWQPSQLPSQPPGSARSVLFTGGLPLPHLWGAPTPLRDLLARGPPSSPEGVRSQASSLSCRPGGPPIHRGGPSFLRLALSPEFSVSLPGITGSFRYQPPSLPPAGLRRRLEAIPGPFPLLRPRGGWLPDASL